jgi:hypothetical protein
MDLRAFGDRLESWFNELSGSEQVILRDILARAAAATRFLEGTSDYSTFDPSDLVYRCGRGCVRDPPLNPAHGVIPPFTRPGWLTDDLKEDTGDD